MRCYKLVNLNNLAELMVTSDSLFRPTNHPKAKHFCLINYYTNSNTWVVIVLTLLTLFYHCEIRDATVSISISSCNNTSRIEGEEVVVPWTGSHVWINLYRSYMSSRCQINSSCINQLKCQSSFCQGQQESKHFLLL